MLCEARSRARRTYVANVQMSLKSMPMFYGEKQRKSGNFANFQSVQHEIEMIIMRKHSTLENRVEVETGSGFAGWQGYGGQWTEDRTMLTWIYGLCLERRKYNET